MDEDPPTVTIPQGQLKGSIGTDYDGGKYLSFVGIPYAKPPVGELRFKAPLPPVPWTGIRDATVESDICYSKDQFAGAIIGSEDCLTVNVFVKKVREIYPPQKDKPLTRIGHTKVSMHITSVEKSCQKLKPVFVWIHGGAFVTGTGNTPHCGPQFLMTEHIVVVTVNYRLGVLGFLSLEDTSLGVPGNAGLKDQSLALKWVHENIKYFGGDPNNITIAGESAGAASVHFQILSRRSKGFFHKAILQSASSLDFWVWGRSDTAKELAKCLGKSVCDEKGALEVLRCVPVEKLYEAQLAVGDSFVPSQHRPFGPVIEKPNDTAFITKNVIDVIISGEYNKVPMIVGYNTKEGMLGIIGKLGPDREPLNLEDDIPWDVNLTKGSEASQSIAKKMRDVYFKSCDDLDNEIVLHTDSFFLAGIIAAVKNHLATSPEPIYLYRMSLDAGLNFLKNFINFQHLPGACHADDLGYMFKNAVTPEIRRGSLEDISIGRFIKLWTNFMKYGNPTPDEKELGIVWEPIREGNMTFVDIGKELTLDVDPEPERMALWKEIFQLNPATAKYL